jgi:AcrR family transcriptional regulator
MRTKGRAHPNGPKPSEGAASQRLTGARDPHAGAPHDGGQAGGLPRPGTNHGGGRGRGVERDGLSDGRVSGFQRARLLAAMTEVSVERGAGNVTVAHVVERAGVSRRTFYELFSDREECFLAALDDGIARASWHVLAAYDPEAKWAERIRTALTALLEFFDVERGVGWLVVVGSSGAGPQALERRRRVLAQITTVVDEGRSEVRGGEGPPPLTAEGAVGAVFSVIHARLLEDDPGGLVGLVNSLMSMIVLPFLGAAAARRELSRPVPEAKHPSVPSGVSNTLRGLEMRLTYRTVRVLMAVAACPGSSNRTVADRAGVGDQGQISKLLGRLEKLGLVANTGLGPGRGAPNAWTLTTQGEEVHGALAAQAPTA